MNLYNLAAIILSFAILATYVNHRYIRLQTTIAIMASSLILSMLLLIAGSLGLTQLDLTLTHALKSIDFYSLLMNGMLSFLLFAGALHVDMNALIKQKWEISVLATLSTIVSTLLVGYLTYTLTKWLGLQLNLVYCMLFGALISPTDPIAVLGTFKQLNAPKALDTQVAGESLFNDGVGIVIFLTIYQLAFAQSEAISWQSVLVLFLQQAVGGILFGALLGYTAFKMIKPIDDHKVEILITLGITTGGYSLAHALHISGPLAMVVAGIFIGNRGRKFHMSAKTRASLDTFWELVDEILNAVLFLLIGFELLLVKANHNALIAALFAIPLVLLVRTITVAIPMSVFMRYKNYNKHTIAILVWGGLRGGLAVALALSLPEGEHRNLILAMTYAVVAFSVIVQGLTIKPLITRAKGSSGQSGPVTSP